MSDVSSKKCATPSELKQGSILNPEEEQRVLEQNVKAGKEAEAVLSLVSLPQPDHFYRRLIELCQEKLPKVIDPYPPMTEQEGIKFENGRVPPGFGKHGGVLISRVPLSYIEALADENSFVKKCKRYVKCDRYKERKKRGE